MSQLSYAEILRVATVKESLAQVDHQIAEIAATIETVLQFPTKISYDAMVPLSKVGFSPGKILHTNEFQVQDERSGERKWLSHVEAADHLKSKMESLKTRRTHLLQQLQDAYGHQSYMLAAPEVDDTTEIYDDTEVVEEVYSGAVAKPKDVQEDQEDVMGSDPFEIREFYDESGKEVRSEVVSLSKAFNSATQNVPKDNDKLNKLYDDIASKLNVDAPVPIEVDSNMLQEQSAFVRELAAASAGAMRPLKVDDWDYLDRLEREEEQEELRMKQLKIDKQSCTAGAGWKKGFLGQKPTAAQKATTQKIKATPMNPAPAPASTAATQLAHKTTMNSNLGQIPNVATPPSTSSHDTSGDNAERPISRFKAARAQQSNMASLPAVVGSDAPNKAFTGQIKER